MVDKFNIKYIDNKSNIEMEMPLEKLVKSLLALEIDINFHIEALKAQAIIIRTNLLRSSKFLGGSEDIKLEIKPLEFFKDIWNENYNKNIDKVNTVVEETKGLVILYDNKPIDAKYHICCGGSTENAENVLGNQVNYLRRVLCNHCKDSKYWESEKTYRLEEIAEKTQTKFPEIDECNKIEILNFIENIEKDQYGRIESIKVGNKNFRGTELMEKLNLLSTKFNIYPSEIKFIFKGTGHGVGLCQQGAEKMAQDGNNFQDILEYYYTRIKIAEFTFPCIEKPLYGKILVIDPGHGGEDRGYIGDYLQTEEKNIAMSLSQILKKSLENKGAVVHLTREIDENILIIERARKTNEIHPDFFISIHLDYYPNSTMKGTEIFYFRQDHLAKNLGNLILGELKAEGIPVRGIKEGNFYVFRGINTSSLLIEIGYLSNPEEEVVLIQEKYLKKLANSIESGILKYFNG